MSDRKTLSVQEAATELRVSVETMRRYIRSGKFPVAKIGRQYLIRPEAIRDFIEGRFAEGGGIKKPPASEGAAR